MHYRKNMKLYVERICLLLKGQKFIAIVPIIIINILIPLINGLIFIKNGKCEMLNQSVNQSIQLFFPFLSSWWVIFALRFYTEEKGNEVLFIGSDKSKLRELILLFIITLANISITCIPYYWLIEEFYKIYAKTILASILYFSISYFIFSFIKSTNFTFIVLICYTLANLLKSNDITKFPFYYSTEINFDFSAVGIPMLFFSAFLLKAGKSIFKHFPFYNI